MTAENGLCDNCNGSGIKVITLFLTLVEDICSLCKGNGKYIYLCKECNKNLASISIDLQGERHLGPCKQCIEKALEVLSNNASNEHFFGL